MPTATLYEGRIIRRKGSFWIVQDGKKRGFANWQTFQSLKLKEEWAHHMRPPDLAAIPDGELLSDATLTKDDIRNLLKYYIPFHRHERLGSNGKAIGASEAGPSTSDNGCPIDKATEDRVYGRNNPDTSAATVPKVMLYIISHDNQTEAQVTNYLSKCPIETNLSRKWVNSFQIPSTPFFESIVYQEIFPKRQNEWENKDYVITATYKTLTTSLHYNQYQQSLSTVMEMLDVAYEGNYDIVPFLRSGSGMMSFCKYWHGNDYAHAWYALLQAMGYDLNTIKKYDEYKPFYRNIYLIKPKILNELMFFMQKAMKIAQENKEVKNLLAKDSKYKEGKEEVALRIFGTKYYQLHPFIFERLPSFFIHVNNYKLCADSSGSCKYNS